MESCQSEGGGGSPRVFSTRKNNVLRVNNLMFTSYGGNNCFIISILLYYVYNLNVLFCRRQQNNFRYREYNYRTGWKTIRFSTDFRLSRLADRAITYCLAQHYICLSCSSGCLPRHTIFRKTSELYYYFYIVNNCLMYNDFV